MNKNATIVAGIVGVVIIVGLVLYFTRTPATTDVVAPITTTSTNDGTVATPSTQTRAPGAPSVTTKFDVVPTDTTVLVTGTINPNGALTNYWYQYGRTVNLGSETTKEAIGSGFATNSGPGYITGLTKDTTYYYQLVAENQYGRVAGIQRSFQTTHGNPAPIGNVPTVKTSSADQITSSAANLNGNVIPNHFATTYWFEYGKTKDLGNTTDFVSTGAGTVNVPVSAALTYLQPATTYYFRLNAQNAFGTVTGATAIFKTAVAVASPVAPIVQTGSANSIKTTSATFRATVNPGGTETKYWFEYSTNSLLNSGVIETSHRSAGPGTKDVAVQTTISSLTSNTTYYYRIVAENNQGTIRGESVTFKTK